MLAAMKILLVFCGLLCVWQVHGAELHISVTGTKGYAGKIVVAVFGIQQAEDFPDKLHKAACLTIGVTQVNTTELVCNNLADGIYAVFAFHDSNSNGRVDHNWLGFPQEMFGFYRHYQVKVLPPDFDDVSFYVTGTRLQIPVALQKY